MLRIRSAIAPALLALLAVAPAASAHEGNPNFSSQVERVAPAVDGLEARVLNYDDSIELRNDTGRTVVVEGYRDEPYVRIAANGTVEVNRRSPAAYLNDDRFADVEVPASADPKAPPEWETVDRTGRYAWHDHRIHWMSEGLPPQVKDEGRETKIFDWRLPVTVAGEPAAVEGALTWVGDRSESAGFPVAAAISLGAAVVAGLVLIVVVRRRRSGRPAGDGPEAW